MPQSPAVPTQNAAIRNKVYYGEYSIEYWIKLLLKENVILPQYQRCFVWEPEDVKALVETIKENRFVPPITIGSFNGADDRMNYIVDGQQRLTSILLAVLGWFPDKKQFEADIFAGDSDEDEVSNYEGDHNSGDGIMKWTYRELLRGSNRTIEGIREACKESNKYVKITELEQNYLKDRYIGFCYLVPDDACGTLDYFANVFMDINANGIPLNPQESRRSLYFLTPGLDAFLEPKCLSNFGIVNIIAKNTTIEHIDFIKYLSIMNEYYAKKTAGTFNILRIAVKFKNQPESYYKSFIAVLSGRNKDDSRFCTPDKWGYKNNYVAAIEALLEAITTMGIQHQFDSIADMDVTFFGLVYWVCYCGRKLDQTKKEEFIIELKNVFDGFRSEKNYIKSSSHLGRLRRRIEQSVELYERYLGND